MRCYASLFHRATSARKSLTNWVRKNHTYPAGYAMTPVMGLQASPFLLHVVNPSTFSNDSWKQRWFFKQFLLISIYFSRLLSWVLNYFLTLPDKISADNIFGGQNISADRFFGTKSKFRQFCPTNFFHRFLITPYNSHKKYVWTWDLYQFDMI